MRICYFADGRSIHTRRWMTYFAQKGHEMHLISYAPMDEENIAQLRDIGVSVHGSSGNFHVKKIWRTIADLRKVKRVLRREKIDVLHCHFLGANAWYAALSGFHPYIITIMGGGDVNGEDWTPNTNVQAKFLTPYALKNADYVTSWSSFMAKIVRPFCRPDTPIGVIHGGIHLDRFLPGEKPLYLRERWQIPSSARIIFSPRLMRPLSNIDKIADAFVKVHGTMPSAVLVIAAPASERDEGFENQIKRSLSSSPARDSVRFIGAISHNEIADYFRFADVTVSIPDTDGTPMTVLESMACGIPTVIGNLPDYDQSYFEDGKTTQMVDVKNPSVVAKAVLTYLTDESLAARISEEAQRRVSETGGYEFQMNKMNEIYHYFAKK